MRKTSRIPGEAEIETEKGARTRKRKKRGGGKTPRGEGDTPRANEDSPKNYVKERGADARMQSAETRDKGGYESGGEQNATSRRGRKGEQAR